MLSHKSNFYFSDFNFFNDNPLVIKPIILSGFTPINIPGLCLWYDANDPLGNNTHPTNNSTLNTIVDKSRKLNDSTQPDIPLQATFNLNIQNGLPGISFTTNNYYNFAANDFSLGSQGRSVFIVYRPLSIDSANYFFYTGSSSSNEAFALEVTTAFTGDNYLFLDGSGTYAGGTTTPFVVDENYLIELYYPDGSDLSLTEIFVNSISQDITQTTGGILDTQSGLAYLNSVPSSAPNAGITGYIFEELIYNQNLNSLSRDAIRNYLLNKWFGSSFNNILTEDGKNIITEDGKFIVIE